MTTTDGKLKLIVTDEWEAIQQMEIQFVPPSLDLNRTANFADVVVVGRNNPQYHYVGGTDDFVLKLDFCANEESRLDVVTKVDWLRSLAMSDGGKRKPQKVNLIFGDIFKGQTWIVRGVNVKYSQFQQDKGFLPQQAYVELRLSLDTENNLNWADVWR